MSDSDENETNSKLSEIDAENSSLTKDADNSSILSDYDESISTSENEASGSDFSEKAESEPESEVEESKNQESSTKRSKIEEEIKPSAPFSTPFGSKMVFGSAAKNIVTFNSIGANSDLPVKSLFAEEICAAPISGPVENEKADFEIITGEEDECTIISMKGKLFEFNPEMKDWHERGIGMFKLNKSKSNGKFRIIMRSDGVQKLILNSNLFPAMVCEVVQEKNLRFSANNFESKIQTFILRMKNSDDAKSLEKTLKDSITSLKVTEEEDC